MRKVPFVSIIIPTRNEERNLPRLLKSIFRLDYPKNKFEVMIVDGNSTDETISIAKKSKVKVLNNPKLIRGAGCQIAIEKARGELIAFTDADCSVPQNWLKGLIKFLGDDPKIAAVGGSNITPKNDSPFAKAVGDVLDVLTMAGSRYGLKSKGVMETFHNPGCNVIYRKQAILDAGGFNENLLTCEDEEFDYRLRRMGYKLLFVPHVSVDHYRRSSYKKILIQAYRFAVGRMEAAKIHPKMIRWFHFIPSAVITTLGLSIILINSTGLIGEISKLYFGLLIFLGVLLSVYLNLIYKHAPFFIYSLILGCWFLGWGVGFVKGFLKKSANQDFNKKNLTHTWESYWRSYHGVTTIGAWSQQLSLAKSFDLIRNEGIKKNVKIIDIGAGEGRTLIAFRKNGFKNSIAIDNTKGSLVICQKNGLVKNKDVFLGDALNTHFKDKEFDLVFSEGLLEHFKDPSLYINEMTRISNKYILLIQPNHYSLYGLLIAVIGNVIRGNVKEYTFTKRFFIKKFKEIGFNLEADKYTPFREFFVLLLKRRAN